MTTAATTTDFVALARSLRPEIEAHSDECQQLRRLPESIVRLLKEHRIFGMARPTDRGGLAAGLLTTLQTVEEISYADASVGWCAAIGSGSIGQIDLPDEAAREVYAPGVFLAGVGSPNGRAIPVDGGYRVSGRWPYASGCQAADWIFAGTIVFDGAAPRLVSGRPDVRVAVVPAEQIEIIDTWHVSGLRGTGSHDVVLRDVFVPADHTAPISLDTNASAGDEFSIPMFTLFGLALAPVAVGAARRAVADLIALAQGKTPLMAGSKLGEKPVTQHEIARAEAIVESGRAYLYAMVTELQDRIQRQADIDLHLRARVRLSATYAADSASQAATIVYRLGGGTSNYESSLLQRCLRDINAVTQHFMLSAANYEATGRVLLGLDPPAPTLF